MREWICCVLKRPAVLRWHRGGKRDSFVQSDPAAGVYNRRTRSMRVGYSVVRHRKRGMPCERHAVLSCCRL